MKIISKTTDGLYRIFNIFGLKIRVFNFGRVRKAHYWVRHENWKLIEANAHYSRKTGVPLDLENPVTFSEKVLWLWKYYYTRLPLFYKLYNKETFKQWMIEKSMGEYVPRLLGAWNNPRDIDWDGLPDKFVLKLAKGSFGKQVMLVHDKSKLNRKRALRKISRWAYYGEKNRIIAEELLSENDDGDLKDYKFFCIDGKPRFIIAYARGKELAGVFDKKRKCYDTNWSPLPYLVSMGITPQRGNIPRPKHLDKMLDLAGKLAVEFPFVRVDLYLVGDHVYVGELTFIPFGGKMIVSSPEYNKKLGDMLKLPEKLPPLKNVCIKTLTLRA
ncbi:MAG: hypothetical protein FWF97_04750 [Alphaproteobacteria bacterium]|nr:hypothetical protein [Alphaproteobacteria bacterium]